MRTSPLTNRGLTLPTTVTLVLLMVLAALVAGASAVSAQGSAPDAPDRPVGTAVFIGGVDLEWNEVPGADSYGVQMYRNGQWTDLPGDGIEIAFYGAGAIINELEPEGSSYWFRVRARSVHGFSEWSDFNFMAPTSQSKSGRQARPENVPASGEPIINGTAQVGESLTADTSDMEDGNGLDRVKFRFQWVSHDGSADTDIANATDSTYTLVAADEGNTIKVWVAFTDRGGYAESLTGVETATVAARPNSPATGAPAVTGTAQVGETLAADTSGIGDIDGLTKVSYSYQWVANDGTADTDITDATDSTYTLAAADEGRTVKVKVSFSDDAGNGETLTSSATAAVAAAPNAPAAGAPAITGTAQVGETLTAGTSGIADVDGLTKVSYSYQWVANDGTSDTDIADATDSTYALVADHEGKTIKVRVSFTDDAGNEETLTSTATDIVSYSTQQQTSNSPATGAPSISGTAQVGETLTADTSGITDADGLSGVSYSYQWVANDGTADTDITDATDSTYILVAANEGKTIKVRVSFTDDNGYAESLTSTATEAVSFAVQQQQASNSPATGAPVITGTVQVGETLTADTTGITDADGLSGATFSYQWVTNDGTADTDITDATDSTFTLVAAYEGMTIKVRVSFTDDAANEESLTSAATGAVAEGPPSHITVVVTEDRSDPNNIVTNFTVTWRDSDGCSTNYNAYLNINPGPEPGHETGSQLHLGSAPSDGAQITKGLTGVHGSWEGFNVELYCGTDESGQLVSKIDIPGISRPRPSTYSSAPLTALTIGSGALSPDFDRGIYRYTAEVPSDVELITLDPVVLTGFQTDIVKDPSGYVARGCSIPAIVCTDWSYGDGTTYGIVLSDADTNTLGFQVNLDRGENRLLISVNKGPVPSNLPRMYDLTVTVQNSSATGAPAISGTAQVGETLTADTSGISDADGLDNVAYSYQWLSSRDMEISGATNDSYALVSGDEGKYIKVRVTFTDDAGYKETLTSAATGAVAERPNSPTTGVPTIGGTARVGETLTADTTGITDADGLDNATFSYQWVANDGSSDTDITDATDSTYTVAEDEEGNTIKVKVTVTDDAGNETTLTTAATDVVDAAPQPNSPATGTPAIAGTAQVGETLTADTSGIADTDGLENVTFTYRWLADDTAVQGATNATYTLVEADEGQTIKVEVSFTDDAGNYETLSSAATAAVAAPQPPAKPTGLSAVVVSHDTVTLAWDDPQDDAITGYAILRRDREIHPVGTFVTITGDTGSADTTYTDDSVEPEKQYNYKIKAINEYGKVSKKSHWVRADTPAVPVPDKPTGLSAAVSHDTVTLTWDDPQDDSITGYVILRRDRAIHPTGTFVTIAGDTGSADTTYTDDSVEPDKEYVYRIKAINEHGEVSERSHWVRGFTPAAPAPAGSPAK